MSESSFQISQGYDVLPPRPGQAYPILCGEWEHLKTQIRAIQTSMSLYHTVGSLLLGAALSTLISIFCGAFPITEGNPYGAVIPWAIVVTTTISGAACLHFAHRSQAVSSKFAHEVVAQMELIEQRYETPETATKTVEPTGTSTHR